MSTKKGTETTTALRNDQLEWDPIHHLAFYGAPLLSVTQKRAPARRTFFYTGGCHVGRFRSAVVVSPPLALLALDFCPFHHGLELESM